MQKPATLTPANLGLATAHLRSADKIMARLIDEHPPFPLPRRTLRPFDTLASAIIRQCISRQSADAVERRVAELAPRPFAAADFRALAPERLRAAGLSNAKARFILELARRAHSGELELEALPRLEDEAVIAALTGTPGVGRWTAEMFLLFGLRRPDVLALGDGALQRSARLLYGDKHKGADVLRKAAEAWVPYRSVASWYLWRNLKPAE